MAGEAVLERPGAAHGSSQVATVLKWVSLGLFMISATTFALNDDEVFSRYCPMINAITFCVFSITHCIERYGTKSTLIFLALAWVISCGLELISVHYGFPFGLYSYVNAPPPIVLGVPVATGAVYFGMAYVSWMLAGLLTGQAGRALQGAWVVRVPVLATFIMVMWDFVLDPVYSTIFSVWVWPNGGSYFGVPLSNFAGWMFSAFVIFQSFALYIRGADREPARQARTRSRTFWYEVILGYFIQGFIFVLFPFGRDDFTEIYRSMALAFVYTMLFVCVLSLVTVWRDGERAD